MTANETQIGGTHYKDMAVQPWDAMRAWMTPEAFRGFLVGNCIKYLSRHEYKGGVEDWKKARHYLDKLIETYPDGPLETTVFIDTDVTHDQFAAALGINEKIDVTRVAAPATDWPGPDWSQAPEWAVWWVAYSDGVGRWACWHRHEPVQGLYGWDDNGAPGESSRAMQASIFGYTGDWRDSLRKRPDTPKCSHAMFFGTARCPDCNMRADQIRQQQQGK